MIVQLSDAMAKPAVFLRKAQAGETIVIPVEPGKVQRNCTEELKRVGRRIRFEGHIKATSDGVRVTPLNRKRETL